MARQRMLSPERKAFINSLLEHYQPNNAADVQDMLKDLLEDILQGMLEAEMDEHLGYSKYDYKANETTDSRNGYSKKSVYVAIGIRLNGVKKVLGMLIGGNESAKYWLGVLNEIKNRGVEDFMFVSVDGLT